jgi:superfamily II DNA or RNA helicase
MNAQQMLISGAYARILDQELQSLLADSPELQSTLRVLDDEEQPGQYSQLLTQLFQSVLRQIDAGQRADLLNRFVELLSAQDGMDYLARRQILAPPKLVTSIHPHGTVDKTWPLPQTALNTSFLFTGAAGAPSLDHELRQEMRSADRVDMLVSFIKTSGLRLLMPALEELNARNIPVRVITTSYMGASDPHAIAWLVRCQNVQVKISYDTQHTRLHAKTYHFYRKSGYSTAYIGSANLTGVAITSGLEWTVKITDQDQPAVLQQFRGEFESYWENESFELCREENLERFRRAIFQAKENQARPEQRFFAEITPRPFQERILDKLEAERNVHGSFRNLVVAATGTGKTVIAGLDYQRICGSTRPRPRLLFLAHRIEILEQARDCYRAVLRDPNFGDLLGGNHQPTATDYLFSTIASAQTRQITGSIQPDYFDYIVVDEAHHGAAPSYQPLYAHFTPRIWLGLTATPERMDGASILPEYNYRTAAEIRLPEALEEHLLCPFHYFGITDPVSLQDDSFWRNGQYNIDALNHVYTGDDIRARQRVDALFTALNRYHPVDENTRAIGFCASENHAEYMVKVFTDAGWKAETLLGNTDADIRPEIVRNFREGRIQVLFTVNVLNEGFDLPEINLVMFLRPTDSLTIFLQQLGRGLRHAPGKDCLTVIDMVGLQHRKYRIDRKYVALLPQQRMRIDEEVDAEFPHLPPGCSILLERVAREHVLAHIRRTLRDIKNMAVESLAALTKRRGSVPTFGEFINYSELSPVDLLKIDTWSGWKTRAHIQPPANEPDREMLLGAMQRIASRNSPTLLNDARVLAQAAVAEQMEDYLPVSDLRNTMLHYLICNKPSPEQSGGGTLKTIMRENPVLTRDILEVATWRQENTDLAPVRANLPFDCPLDLHAMYSSNEIKAALGVATYLTAGATGTGVIPIEHLRVYVHLVTFNKSDKDFSPTNRYHDYLLNRKRLHWESQSRITRASPTGQNYIHFQDRGYTILFFARINKNESGFTCPFTYLGPASELLSFEGDRPIKMIWGLSHSVPAQMYEQARVGG